MHGAHTLLAQLVDNLLDNACKYSEAGTPVTLRVSAEPDSVRLLVADEGIGIEPADLPHVFEPFYRSPQARRLGRGGVGLGLAVARRIAEAFGGALDVTSEPGKGSCFTLTMAAAGLELADKTPAPSPLYSGERVRGVRVKHNAPSGCTSPGSPLSTKERERFYPLALLLPLRFLFLTSRRPQFGEPPLAMTFRGPTVAFAPPLRPQQDFVVVPLAHLQQMRE